MTNYLEAVDTMFSMFATAWAALSTSIVGYVPEVTWQDETFNPDPSKFWVRVSQNTVGEGQAALRNGESRRYRAEGLLFVQLFCPLSEVNPMDKGRQLAQFARNIYRGKTGNGGITFDNVRIRELGDEELYKRLNVIAEYEYDEMS